MIRFGDIETPFYSNGYFKKFPTLFIPDIPTDKDLQKGKLPEVQNDNQIFLFAKSYDLDIKVETIFNTLLPYSSVYDFIKTKVILKYVSVNPSYEIDYIPRGYSALCLFEFENGKPELLNKLAYFMEKKQPEHDRLILTQQPLLDIIMEYTKN